MRSRSCSILKSKSNRPKCKVLEHPTWFRTPPATFKSFSLSPCLDFGTALGSFTSACANASSPRTSRIAISRLVFSCRSLASALEIPSASADLESSSPSRSTMRNKSRRKVFSGASRSDKQAQNSASTSLWNSAPYLASSTTNWEHPVFSLAIFLLSQPTTVPRRLGR